MYSKVKYIYSNVYNKNVFIRVDKIVELLKVFVLQAWGSECAVEPVCG